MFNDKSNPTKIQRSLQENKEFKDLDEHTEGQLEKCGGFSEIFELVKKVVKETLNHYRVGLMLVLADLPMGVGAFHTLGSNTIVMNRRLLHHIEKENPKHKKEFIFLILLHEYLHTIGYTDEVEVRELSYKIVAEAFGVEHPVTQIAERGPLSIMPELSQYKIYRSEEKPELIKDFEKTNQTYIQ